MNDTKSKQDEVKEEALSIYQNYGGDAAINKANLAKYREELRHLWFETCTNAAELIKRNVENASAVLTARAAAGAKSDELTYLTTRLHVYKANLDAYNRWTGARA
jgi:hypothetical protein